MKPSPPADKGNVPSWLKGGSLFADTATARAVFVGILLGAVALSVVGAPYERHLAARQREEAARTVSSSPNTRERQDYFLKTFGGFSLDFVKPSESVTLFLFSRTIKEN